MTLARRNHPFKADKIRKEIASLRAQFLSKKTPDKLRPLIYSELRSLVRLMIRNEESPI